VPVYMEISRLHRTVTLVARGKIAPDEIRGMAMKLVAEKVRSFAKILEVTGATTTFTVEQIVQLGEMLKGASTERRGPIAFVIDDNRTAFPQAFAAYTEREGPIKLFTSLHAAREWTQQILHAPETGDTVPHEAAAAALAEGQHAWTDPRREGTMIRGVRQRDVPIKSMKAA
jgi:hypothetical protein